jgi:hypothetical protein
MIPNICLSHNNTSVKFVNNAPSMPHCTLKVYGGKSSVKKRRNKKNGLRTTISIANMKLYIAP